MDKDTELEPTKEEKFIFEYPKFIVRVLFCFWLIHCISRFIYQNYSCSDEMLQQLTSYYETMITILVMIITILLATSFVSIYYVTKRQVRSVVEETVEKEIQERWLKKEIPSIITERLRSPEMVDFYDNNTNCNSRIEDLENSLNSDISRIEGNVQEIQSDIESIKRSYC